jgi:hypothetical protein
MRELLSVSDSDLQANEKNWPKKADYVVAFTGNLLGTWQIRGVSPFYSDGSDLQKDGGYEMNLISETRRYFPALFFNVWTRRPDFQQTYAGYKLYRVVDGPKFRWLGKYPDGWIGKSARLTIYPAYIDRVLVTVATSKYNPQNGITVLEHGAVRGRASLSEGQEHTIELTAQRGSEPTVFEFDVARTFVPKKLHINDDARELGVMVRLQPFAPKKTDAVQISKN